MSERAEGSEQVRSLIEGGAEIAGGAVGGALGFLAGGPLGAAGLGALGVAAGRLLNRIGQEASDRLLGPRERIRLGGVLALAAADIDRRVRRGERLRDDGFFGGSDGSRSGAEEVAESILLKSQREPEEKKLPYMAKLLSGVAFRPDISADMAHQLAKAAEQLTYRQLCILRVAAVKQGLSLRHGDYRGSTTFSKDLYQVLYECLDLYHRALINFGGEVLFGPTDVAPAKMNVQGLGADLYQLMGLDGIPITDLDSVIRVLA